MNFKTILIISLFSGFILFSSCGNESANSETKNSDSLKPKLPVELAKLNEQIAADPKNADLFHNAADARPSSIRRARRCRSPAPSA